CDAVASAERDHEQQRRGTDRVREGDENRLEPEMERRRRVGDECESRAGAGDEYETERAPEEESAAEVALGAVHEPGQRPFDEHPELRDHEHRAEQEEQPDRDVPEQILGKSEPVEDPDGEEDRDVEANGETGDDRQRSPAALAHSAAEDDRQHREHAGRDDRDYSCEQGQRNGDYEHSTSIRSSLPARLLQESY